MGSVIASFLPLAVASVAPVFIALMILMLGREKGFAKAAFFVAGKALAYFILAGIFFWLAGRASDAGGEESEQSTVVAGIKIILGVLFLVMAVKTVVSEEDPDAPPSRLQTAMDRMNAEALFLVGLGISFIQLRYVMLVAAGVSIILDEQLSTTSDIIATIILVIFVTWTLLLPLVIYVAMGARAAGIMDRMNGFLTKYQKPINVVVLVLFGVVLLNSGLDAIS